MLTVTEQAAQNLHAARSLRAAGRPYREIGRRLGLSSGQLSQIRRVLKREKAAQTRLIKADSSAMADSLPVSQSSLPKGLRDILLASGLRTLGEVAQRIADPERPGLVMIAGIGPHRARLVEALLDQFGLKPETEDLRAAIEEIFPELQDV